LEFDVEERFFLKQKKMSNFFSNQLWIFCFVFIVVSRLLILYFTFFSSSSVFVCKYVETWVCI
jgi:hypothetical protein